jgi:hypothetical protein
MKVKDLIEALKDAKVNGDAEVYVWVDGARYRIAADCPVDPWADDGSFIDINATED